MSVIQTLKRKSRNFINLLAGHIGNWHHRNKVKGRSVETVFTYIHDNNFWGDKESVSGAGSNTDQTRAIVEAIPGIFERYKITSMLDLPCGDFNWMQKISLNGISYTGGDIVEKIVTENQRKYGRPNISFKKLNIISDELPAVDLVLCRDCFIHLSNEQVLQSLANLKKQNIRYLLTTSFTQRTQNKNIVAGEWRPINLEIAPFHLKPLEIINEHCTEDEGRCADKSLLLIDLKQ